MPLLRYGGATLGALVVVLLWCGVLPVLIAQSAVVPPMPEAVLVSLTVLHRHGARLPMPPQNQDELCDGPFCGQLTTSGAAMLRNLGRFVSDEYSVGRNSDDGATLAFSDPRVSTALNGSTYSPMRVVSRSTDVDRTLQSGDAFLNGLLGPRESVLLPVLHTVPEATDYELLVWASWPSLLIQSTATSDAFNALMNARIADLFIPSDYARIGAELKFDEALCPAQPFQCTLAAQDIISCALSNMPLDVVAQRYPFSLSKVAALNEVLIRYNAVSMYNTSRLFDRMIGAKGFPLAMSIANHLQEDAAATTNGSARVALHHYSGHDITLMPFAEAIGNVSLVNPLFGAAYMVELWRSPREGPWVRLRYAEPSQNFGSGFEIHHHFYAGLNCVRGGNNETYAAPRDVGCPLADWQRYLSTRRPQSQAAWCYLTPDLLTMIDCLPGSPRDAALRSPTGLCSQYRALCPAWACAAPGFEMPSAVPPFVMTPGSVCVSTAPASGGETPAPSPSSSLLGLTGWQVAVGAAACAMVVCTVIGAAIHVYLVGRAEERLAEQVEIEPYFRGGVGDAADPGEVDVDGESESDGLVQPRGLNPTRQSDERDGGCWCCFRQHRSSRTGGLASINQPPREQPARVVVPRGAQSPLLRAATDAAPVHPATMRNPGLVISAHAAAAAVAAHQRDSKGPRGTDNTPRRKLEYDDSVDPLSPDRQLPRSLT